MKIPHKMTAMTLFLVLLAWGVGFFAVGASRKVLRAFVESNALATTEEIMDDVDRMFQRHCLEWQAYSASPLVQRTIKRSNQSFAERGNPYDSINAQDEQWRAAEDGGSTALMESLMDNALSKDLRARLAVLDAKSDCNTYGEVFVTNRYGANVALSGRTTDYRQDDESWWQQAWRDGLYVGEVVYDNSSGAYCVDICTRVDDSDGAPIGVIKAVLDIGSVTAILRERAQDLTTATRGRKDLYDLLLLTADGRIVCSYHNPTVGLADGFSYGGNVTRDGDRAGYFFERRDPEQGQVLAACAFSRGHGEFKGLGWICVAEFRSADVFAPTTAVQHRIVAVSTLIGIGGLVVGLALSLSLSRRIARLRNAAVALGRGDLNARCQDSSSDEVGELATCFNQMGCELQHSATRLRQHAELLERQVEDRTENLRREVRERERMQLELVRAQKLESVGQLAAGIAHEINTPAQYVSDNTRFLQDAFASVDRLLVQFTRLLEAANGDAVSKELLTEIDSAVVDSDIDYLREDIPKAIEQSLEGLDRVAGIVRAMKEFSHPGGDTRQPIDLNRAIESTLTVSRNEWKYVADVVTDFDPELPLVPCLAGDVNQVVLNLVVNAAHAIAEVAADTPGEKGTITVQTRRDADWAEIRVRDTGTGIPEGVRDRVFDHFFTTKEVGKGTGQGLTIAYSLIVGKHGGTIDFETAVGRGTTFIVRLPLAPSEEQLASATLSTGTS